MERAATCESSWLIFFVCILFSGLRTNPVQHSIESLGLVVLSSSSRRRKAVFKTTCSSAAGSPRSLRVLTIGTLRDLPVAPSILQAIFTSNPSIDVSLKTAEASFEESTCAGLFGVVEMVASIPGEEEVEEAEVEEAEVEEAEEAVVGDRGFTFEGILTLTLLSSLIASEWAKRMVSISASL